MISDFLRYSCQIALPGFDERGQLLLQDAKVLVVGAGGLGCPAAQYLVAAGVGLIGIADDDVVSVNNLHRQVLYGPADTGQKKALLACERLRILNPDVKLVPHDLRITSDNAMDIISQYDILVDCTDNFDTRYLLNDAAVLSGKPLVYGAIYQYEGRVAVWNVVSEKGKRSPNYRDLFPAIDASQIPDCTEGGVIPTLAGIVGCMQANEVIKYITGIGELLSSKLLVFDAQSMQSRVIKLSKTTNTHINRLVRTITVPTISRSELQEGMLNNTLQLIDVRTRQEYDDFNIGGQLIPLDDLFYTLDDLDFKTKTVICCTNGKRSAEALKGIKRRFPSAEVFSLIGGLKGV